jgi:putative Ca2+/H+ antiporter (TMEM165/GDT1 family)
MPGMTTFLPTFATSFILVLVAEMADKTQLLTLSLSCRYPARKVLIGVGIAIALLNLIAVVIGALAGRFIPVTAVKIGAGVLFIGFGLWNLLAKEKPAESEEECEVKSSGRFVILGIAAAFFVAEIGDKTQLATLSLGARYEGDLVDSLAVWVGATLGMILANALAVIVGHLAGRRLPERLMKRISGGLFIAFGIWTLVETFL